MNIVKSEINELNKRIADLKAAIEKRKRAVQWDKDNPKVWNDGGKRIREGEAYIGENEHLLSLLEELHQYREIGTVVELRELKENATKENRGECIFCTDGSKAYVGDKIRVIGMPERFFRDERIDVVGIIREIGWYEDDTCFGFVLEDTNKFYMGNCEEVTLIK